MGEGGFTLACLVAMDRLVGQSVAMEGVMLIDIGLILVWEGGNKFRDREL